MSEETGPPESKPPTMSPLVDWMSRHGWKVLVALVAIELLFHAFVMGAQERAPSVDVTPMSE